MAIQWVEVSEDRFHEMLGVLPPAAMAGDAFQVGEASDHRNGRPTFATFCQKDGKFWESADSCTFNEFKGEFPGAEYYYEG